MQLKLDDIEVKFKIDNLKINLTWAGYGVFRKSFPRHSHGKDYYEIHLITQGKGVLATDEGDFPLEKGSAFMTGPFVNHAQLTDEKDFMEEFCIGFYAKRNENIDYSLLTKEFTDKNFWIGMDEDDTLLKLFSDLEMESINRQVGYMENIRGLITAIIVQITRLYTGHMHGMVYDRPTPDDRRMIIIDNWFLFSKNKSLEKLAEALNLSPRQTQRFLKKQYGKTFSQLKKG